MKLAKTIKWVLGFAAVCFAHGVLAADPTISDVVARQRWPWSQLVNIDYVLTCDVTQSVDVVITAKDGSATLTLPSESLSGDLYGVTSGMKRIIFDPFKTAYTNSQMLTQFSVTLAPTIMPVYMIVDLTKSAGEEDQIEYIYPGDERLETYGQFTNVWFGVTNDSVYATDKLVLRRVHADTFGFGSSKVSTTLTKDFYASVFTITAAQWDKIMTGSSSSLLPKVSISYETVRGATNSAPSVNWPSTKYAVLSSSFIGQLRSKTGFDDFDLPTEAQWEYLCRAGTTSYYNDGESTSYTDTNTNILNRIAWWIGNSGNVCHSVGGREPNNWGLYDTLGNVWEWCLDWYGSSLTGGADPEGPETGSKRVIRGMSFGDIANVLYVTNRSQWSGASAFYGIGFRIVRPLQ